jgi:hypothetical protein
VKRLLLIIALFALIAAACTSSDGDADTEEQSETTVAEAEEGDSGEVAATVGEVDITVVEVEGLQPESEVEMSEEDFTQFLGAVISWRAIAQAAADEFDVEPGGEEIDAEMEQIVSDFGQGAAKEEFLETQGISESVLRETAAQFLIQKGVEEELSSTAAAPTDEEAAQALEDEPMQWTTVCASHILVESEEEATEVITRIEAGEEFAVVAQQVSTDTGSGAEGGSLGCTSPSGYVPEFAEATMTAEIGEITDPVESQFGFHVIRVESREVATTEEILESLSESSSVAQMEAWYLDALTNAEVVVVSRFGTWVTEPTPQVQPPS